MWICYRFQNNKRTNNKRTNETNDIFFLFNFVDENKTRRIPDLS